MGGDRSIRGLVSASPGAASAVRRVVASWRALTGGACVGDLERRTLVACSGGVDSMALAAALASASSQVVIAHVLHDMRPKAQAEASRDAAFEFAQRFGAACVERTIAVRGEAGNYEGNARRARYRALAELARETGCKCVATGHHANDQLETMLMRLMRGAGPRGLGGLARKRRLAGGDSALWLIRPMLVVDRADAVEICKATQTAWVEDETNQELTPLRNALRHRVVPILRELAPRAGEAACTTAELMRQAAHLVSAAARVIIEKAERSQGGALSLSWRREELRALEPIVLGEVVSLAAAEVGVASGADRRGARSLEGLLAAMLDESTEPRRFSVGGLEMTVDARNVVICGRPLPSGL
jgi:tRNA(Ile)-lysidine synthase